MPLPTVVPETAEIACWRLVPAARPSWQGGILRHDEDLGGWSWDDGEGPEDVAANVPKAYWTPPILDAHTHLGDAFLRPERHLLPRDLVQLVAPPDGYKHRRLREAAPKTIRDAMHTRARAMTERGTVHALDFREGGVAGVRLLGQALQKTGLGVTAFGRPAAPVGEPDAWTREVDELLELPDVAIGLSALSDVPAVLAEHAADACRSRGRRLALHLSERVHEDMEKALSLQPALLVHLNQATTRELAAMADAQVLAVACPTSNRFFGLRAPLEALLAASRDNDLSVAFGTDNAMLSDGDIKDEARAAAALLPDAPADWVFRAMTWSPWQRLRLGPDPAHRGLLWGIHPKAPATHPEETPISRAHALLDTPVALAPRL